jgi:hypothetical protein
LCRLDNIRGNVKCAGLQIVEVASTSSYQLQLQQLQAEEAAAGAKAAADARQAELQAALDSMQQARQLFIESCSSLSQQVLGHQASILSQRCFDACRPQSIALCISWERDTSMVPPLQAADTAAADHTQQLKAAEVAAATKQAETEVEHQAVLLAELERYRVRSICVRQLLSATALPAQWSKYGCKCTWLI